MDFPDWGSKTLKRNAVFVLALFSLVMFMHEIFGHNGYLTYRHQKKEYNRLQQDVQTLSQQNQELQQKINALKNNPEAVLKQAHDQLHLVKPGQLVYMLPDKKAPQTTASAPQTSPGKSKPWR